MPGTVPNWESGSQNQPSENVAGLVLGGAFFSMGGAADWVFSQPANIGAAKRTPAKVQGFIETSGGSVSGCMDRTQLLDAKRGKKSQGIFVFLGLTLAELFLGGCQAFHKRRMLS